MRPVLFTWRGHAVPSYPAMLYVGLVLGLVAGNLAANATGRDGARVYPASVALLPHALVGARLGSVLANWRAYRGRTRRLRRLSQGGQPPYRGAVAASG